MSIASAILLKDRADEVEIGFVSSRSTFSGTKKCGKSESDFVLLQLKKPLQYAIICICALNCVFNMF